MKFSSNEGLRWNLNILKGLINIRPTCFNLLSIWHYIVHESKSWVRIWHVLALVVRSTNYKYLKQYEKHDCLLWPICWRASMKVFFHILGSTNSNLPFSLNFLHSFIFQLYSRWEVIRHDLVVTYLFFLANLMTSRMDVIQSLICVVRKWSLITNLSLHPQKCAYVPFKTLFM